MKFTHADITQIGKRFIKNLARNSDMITMKWLIPPNPAEEWFHEKIEIAYQQYKNQFGRLPYTINCCSGRGKSTGWFYVNLS